MKVGLNTYGFIYRESVLETIPRLAATAGVKSFEILASPGHCFPRTPRERKELAAVIKSAGVEVSALNLRALDQNLVSDYADAQAMALGHYRLMVNAAAAAGIPFIVVVPGRSSSVLANQPSVLVDRFVKVIRELNALALDEGVGILLENVPFGFLGDTASLTAMVKTLGEPNINIVLDVANAAYVGEDYRQAYSQASRYVRMVHLSNTTMNKLSHNPFNAGVISMRDALGFFRDQTGVDYLNVEVVGSEREIVSDFGVAQEYSMPKGI